MGFGQWPLERERTKAAPCAPSASESVCQSPLASASKKSQPMARHRSSPRWWGAIGYAPANTSPCSSLSSPRQECPGEYMGPEPLGLMPRAFSAIHAASCDGVQVRLWP